jgi:hypothetical protein
VVHAVLRAGPPQVLPEALVRKIDETVAARGDGAQQIDSLYL